MDCRRLEIHLARNRVLDAGCCALAEALWRVRGLESFVLDLDHNGVGDVGCVALAEGLGRCRLKDVKVSLRSNRVEAEGRAAMGKFGGGEFGAGVEF